MRPASATSRRSPRCRPASIGKPWAADIHFTPTAASSTPASAARARSPRSQSIAKGGWLTLLGRVETATEPRGFAIDPSGRWLLAAGQASHCLRVHAIDAKTGALSPHADWASGSNPNWVEIVALG